MLAKVLTLCLLVSLTLAAARSKDRKSVKRDDGDNVIRFHKTVEARLLAGVKLRRGPSYLVPAGQCNVTLSPRELCGEGLVVASLEVVVLYPGRQYADVMFEIRDEHRVRVELEDCSDTWFLDLRLACLRQKPSRSRSRVPLLLDP